MIMTNDELQEIMKSPNGISPDDFDRIWADMKALDARREAEWDALPNEEKKRLQKEFSDPSLDRFIEDPLGGGDEG